MSKDTVALDDSIRTMTADEYEALRNDPRCCQRPLSLERATVMRSIEWGDVKPSRLAWDFVDMALGAAEQAAQARWRVKNAVRTERLPDGCFVYRVTEWEERAAKVAAVAKGSKPKSRPRRKP